MRTDLMLHFVAGLALDWFGYFLADLAGVNHDQAQLAGFLFSVGISAGKELVWDLALGMGDPDPGDFTFGAFGAAGATFFLTLRF